MKLHETMSLAKINTFNSQAEYLSHLRGEVCDADALWLLKARGKRKYPEGEYFHVRRRSSEQALIIQREDTKWKCPFCK